jgi:outer membrane protein TolC
MNKVPSFMFTFRLKFCWVFAVVVAASVTASGQRTLTLSQAINNAFSNRKNIQAGKSDLIIRQLQTEALYRKYWPQVNAEYTYLYNPILQTSILPIGVFNPAYPADATKSIQFGTNWSQAAGVTVSQPLLDMSIHRQISESKLQERITAATQAQTEYELAYTVAQVYFDIYLQQSKIQSTIADTNRTWQSWQLLQNEFEQQRLLKSALNKGKINHNNAVQLFRNAVSKMIEDKVYLLFLIGQNDIEYSDVVVDTSFLRSSRFDINNIQPKVSSIPELQALELKGEMALLQTNTEKAKFLPTVSMKGYLGANQFTNNFDPIAANSWFGLSYVGLNVKYPLLFGEDKHRKVQQYKVQATQYAQQKDDKAAQYYKDAITAKIKVELALTELKTQQDNLSLGVESIAILQLRVAEGQESASTLNIEEADLQKLNADYESSKMQYWLSILNYLKASGTLEVLWKQ